MTVDVRDHLFIGGRLTKASASARIPVINPATEEHFASIVDADARDVDSAVAAADAALNGSPWRSMEPPDRAQALRRLADGLEARAEELGSLVSRQNGTAISRSKLFNGIGPARYYRYFADLADALTVEEVWPTETGSALIRTEPVGVAAIIVPWNGPQGSVAWKLGPALAAGATAVVKPAPETSLDSFVLAEVISEAGIPDGVVNIITGGRETGAALVSHPLVRKVSFTGSTGAGRSVAAACAADFKRMTLELGGKSAAIILDDLDLADFVPYVASACSPMSGQVCRALTRILAPVSRYDEVVDAVAAAMEAIPTGDPCDPSTVFGPLVAERQRERVEGYIRLGREEGAKVVTGGSRPSELERGWYVEPTVMSEVHNEMRVAREEIFGPVLVVVPYRDDDEAVQLANDSAYGLGGGVFTSDLDRGLDLARRMQTGTVGVNEYGLPVDAPFGGVKQSGIGRELGPQALHPYLETKTVYLPKDR